MACAAWKSPTLCTGPACTAYPRPAPCGRHCRRRCRQARCRGPARPSPGRGECGLRFLAGLHRARVEGLDDWACALQLGDIMRTPRGKRYGHILWELDTRRRQKADCLSPILCMPLGLIGRLNMLVGSSGVLAPKQARFHKSVPTHTTNYCRIALSKKQSLTGTIAGISSSRCEMI